MTSKDTKIFCLLSGGIDSTTVLAQAALSFPDAEIECVTFDYGQRHRKEIQAAEDVAQHYGAKHVVINLQGFLTGMLVDKAVNDEIPNVDYADLPKGISPTYVSFRNGTMLSLLAARAQSWVMERQAEIEKDWLGGVHGDGTFLSDGKFDPTDRAPLNARKEEVNAYIYCGVHADDAANWAYPDCTPEFIGGMANAIHVGTYQRVRLKAPMLEFTKAMIVQLGLQWKVPYHLTWSCYVGGEHHCGICPTCRSRRDAFTLLRRAGLSAAKDPTVYAADPE